MYVEQSSRENGKTTNSKAMDRRIGLIMLCIKESILKERNVERVDLSGQTIHVTKDNSKTITYQGTESTSGETGESSKER
jgi:hypothetical protein